MISNYVLGSEYLHYSDYTRELTGGVTGTCYMIEMPLRVRVSDVNSELGHINFDLVDRKSSGVWTKFREEVDYAESFGDSFRRCGALAPDQ